MTARAVLALTMCVAAAARAGELSRRFELSLARALVGGPPRYTEEFLLADLIANSQRRFSEFSGDLSGRYLGATAAGGPRALETARVFAPRVFALQQADGGFGPPFSTGAAYSQDMAKLWGHGRMLVGLLDYFETTRDPQGLAAARRLGDFLVAHADRFNAPAVRQALSADRGAHGYTCWTQNVAGLVRLARATGEERYRKVASEIANTFEILPGQHAHGALATLRGLALLAEQDPAFTARVEREWESLIATGNVLWNGGPPEYFSSGGRDEGCASADWLRLNLALWRLTERARYLEAAEDALFNAFFGNQLPSGDFAHLTFSQDGLAYGAVEAWWCCTLHGLRAFPEVQASAFRAAGETLYYDLPVDGRGALEDFEVQADAEPARDGKVTLRVVRAPARPIAVHVRRPARTAELRSELGSSREEWLALERKWKAGESVEIDYVFETELVQVDGAKVVKRGPWTLGISEGGDPAYFNEGYQSHHVDFASLSAGDRPSRVAAEFHARGFDGQAAAVTFRPLAERWESAGHGLRWTARFEQAPSPAEAKSIRVVRALYENREALAAGFGVGVLFSALSFWLWRRRRTG